MPVTWISIEKKKGKNIGVPRTDAICHLFLKVTDSVNIENRWPQGHNKICISFPLQTKEVHEES